MAPRPYGIAPRGARALGGAADGAAARGHTHPRMTLGVYAQLLKLGHGNVEALEQVMGCTRDEAA